MLSATSQHLNVLITFLAVTSPRDRDSQGDILWQLKPHLDYPLISQQSLQVDATLLDCNSSDLIGWQPSWKTLKILLQLEHFTLVLNSSTDQRLELRRVKGSTNEDIKRGLWPLNPCPLEGLRCEVEFRGVGLDLGWESQLLPLFLRMRVLASCLPLTVTVGLWEDFDKHI